MLSLALLLFNAFVKIFTAQKISKVIYALSICALVYVLDTSAILAGIKPKPEEVAIPQSVLDEVHGNYPELALYRVLHPSPESIEKVKEASRKTGDYEVLSTADIEVLALALDMNAILITDDYAIQNVAQHLGVKYETGEMQGIKEMRRWKWRCESCGRYFRRYYEECPVCGGKLRRVRSR